MNRTSNRFLIAAATSLVGLLTVGRALGQSRTAHTGASDQFVGAWRLVALEHSDANGKTSRCDCTGMFVFTRDGHAAVQVMDHHPAAGAESGYSQGGYEATFGSYVVDERTRTFTLRVEGALARSLIGKDLPRRYELTDNRLVVRPVSAAEQWSVIWERY
jgi:hypothetical protein